MSRQQEKISLNTLPHAVSGVSEGVSFMHRLLPGRYNRAGVCHHLAWKTSMRALTPPQPPRHVEAKEATGNGGKPSPQPPAPTCRHMRLQGPSTLDPRRGSGWRFWGACRYRRFVVGFQSPFQAPGSSIYPTIYKRFIDGDLDLAE